MEKPRPEITKYEIGEATSTVPSEDMAPEIAMHLEEGSTQESAVVYALPVAQGVNITPKMRSVEVAFDEPILALLSRLYTEEEKTTQEVADVIGVSGVTVYSWLVRLGIARRSIGSPTYIARRAVGVRKAWAERGDEIVKKIHTADSAKKHSETLRQRYNKNPDLLHVQREIVRAAGKVFLEQSRIRREQAFGEDIAERLYTMHHVQGLTLREIAQEVGYHESAVLQFFHDYGVEYVPKTHVGSVRIFQEALATLWGNPEAFQDLDYREKEIFNSRFLTEGPMPTLEEIAHEWGITRQRAYQVEQNALRKIHKAKK